MSDKTPEWDEIEHGIENINRNLLLLRESTGSIERSEALLDIEMQMETLSDSIKEAKNLFDNG